MRRLALVVSLALFVLAPFAHGAAIPAGPYFARGDFYCVPGLPGSAPPDYCWGYSPWQQLFDDGLHGDGAANDGVFAADVPVVTFWGICQFKVANADWSFNVPTEPNHPLFNGYLWPNFPGEKIHFQLDVNPPGGGWVPDVAVANDHGYPAGFALEVIGSAPELGNWNSGLPASHEGSVWTRTVVIATPGSYEYKFRCLGTWDYANFGIHYNNIWGANAAFTTTIPNEPMLFQFDESSGRLRAVRDEATPVRHGTWGSLKAAYR